MAATKFTLTEEELEKLVAERMASGTKRKISEMVKEVTSQSEPNPAETEEVKTVAEASKAGDSGKSLESDPIEMSNEVAKVSSKGIELTDVTEGTPEGGSDSVVRPSLTQGNSSFDVLVTPGGGNVTDAGLADPEVKDTVMADVEDSKATDVKKSETKDSLDKMMEDSEQEVQSVQKKDDEIIQASKVIDSMAKFMEANPLPLRIHSENEVVDQAVNQKLEEIWKMDEVTGEVNAQQRLAEKTPTGHEDGSSTVPNEVNLVKPKAEKSGKKRKAPTPSTGQRRNLRSGAKAKVPKDTEIKFVDLDEKEEEDEPNDGEDKEAEEEFLIKDHQVIEGFFKENRLNKVFEWIKFQGWENLFLEDIRVNPDDVREFYKVVRKEEKDDLMYLFVEFKGDMITINSKQLARLLGISHEGYDTFNKHTWPKKITLKEKEEITMRVCNQSLSEKLKTNKMSTEVKLMHKLLITNFLPRSSKPTDAQIQDILVLNKMIQGEKINLPKLMIHQMEYLSKVNHAGYGRFIKRILEKELMYSPVNEISMMNPLNSNALIKMFMHYIEGEGWVRKLRDKSVKDEVAEEQQIEEESKEHHLSKDLYEQLKAELKADLVANRREMTLMKKEFKTLCDKMVMVENALVEHSRDYNDIAKAIKKIAGRIKDSGSSTSGKAPKSG